jgi:colanic acid biosynthesis protein WcaH
LQRVAVSELGLQAGDVQGARLMGVWDHFYEHSAFSAEVSTHYVNLPHTLRLPHAVDINSLSSNQHSAWRWQDVQAAVVAGDVHPYVRFYAKWVVDEGVFTAPNYS